MSCWGLTSGNAGMIAQVKALASVMGETPEMKNIVLKPWFSWIPNSFAARVKTHLIPNILMNNSDSLNAPYPDIVISCGRRAAMAAMGLRSNAAKAGAATKFIHIQDPHVAPTQFDVVVAMAHDAIHGANVISMQYALHMITPEKLTNAAQQFTDVFEAYPKPHIAVLLGGTTNKYEFTKGAMAQVIMQLQQVLQNTKGSLLITPSKRTGDDNMEMLRSAFANNTRVYVYDFVSENPYMAMLGLAQTIIVSDDSVNMMSEAVATGKPVYLLQLPGHEYTKPYYFSHMLMTHKEARPLSKHIETFSYTVPSEMQRIGQQIRDLLE